MKAAVIYENGDPGVLRYEEVPDPECPDGFVIIDAEAISIEGGDLLARAGGQLPAVPHVVGYLSAGTVSEVAHGVEGRAVGDRVVALNAAGSHAARRAVPAAMTWLVPAGLDAARAACVPVAFGTAYECLFTAGNLAQGQTVLIHAGAGGVGMAAIQLAKRAGATVISTASSDEKLERLKALAAAARERRARLRPRALAAHQPHARRPAGRRARRPSDGLVRRASLDVLRTEQRHEPAGPLRVRFVGLDHGFIAELELDEHGFVTRYPGLAERA